MLPTVLHIRIGPISFPKGKVDKGETEKQAALREVAEESGVVAKIFPGSHSDLGVHEGGYSKTRYFLMYAVRTGAKMDKETKEVLLLPWMDAIIRLGRAGNKRDVEVCRLALKAIEKIKAKKQ